MLEVRWLERISFKEALATQEEIVAGVREARLPDTLLLLEHDPVYTIGRGPNRSSLGDADLLPHPLHEINRGGRATYHGPGQLVGYALLNLNQRGRDLHQHLRFLENFLIQLAAQFSVSGCRREEMTGCWVESRKLASIGVGVRNWITMHGFGLNVTPESLQGFAAITPCGLTGVEMTCLASETGSELTVPAVADQAADLFQRMHDETSFPPT